jgi:hypothetical protein
LSIYGGLVGSNEVFENINRYFVFLVDVAITPVYQAKKLDWNPAVFLLSPSSGFRPFGEPDIVDRNAPNAPQG